MLSSLGVLILGLIEQLPQNPYEIIKTLDGIGIKHWMHVSESSVYAAVKALLKEELVSAEHKKDGNMPIKTVYKITQKGSRIMRECVESYLANPESLSQEMDTACLLLPALDVSVADFALQEKIRGLERLLSEWDERILDMAERAKLPFYVVQIEKHKRSTMQLELLNAKELLIQLKKSVV